MARLLRNTMLLAAVMLLISSCATLSGSGVGRVKHYVVESDRLPAPFDGVTVAFISDLHFPSKFTPKRLRKLVARLRDEAPDVLLLGGDYAASGEQAKSLFSAFSSLNIAFGKYAVLGNHDTRLRDTLRVAMESAGVRLLADEVVCVERERSAIALVGVGNSFSPSPAVLDTLSSVSLAGFTIAIAHTPDFAQDTDAACALVLAGHTHGGQVSLLGFYTPVKNTKYGKRFLRGLNKTSKGVPVITTNGVGTSRRKVRFCVPSEIVIITLRSCLNSE